MENEIEICCMGKLRCLHCGELIDLEKDIHFCNSEKNEWLNKTKKAYMELPSGELWDLKNKCIVSLKD